MLFHLLSNGRNEIVVFVNTTSGDNFELPDDTMSAGSMFNDLGID